MGFGLGLWFGLFIFVVLGFSSPCGLLPVEVGWFLFTGLIFLYWVCLGCTLLVDWIVLVIVKI